MCTDHCGVQERGDVEDFVQSQCRVDASVVFASAKNTQVLRKKKKKRAQQHLDPSMGITVPVSVVYATRLIEPRLLKRARQKCMKWVCFACKSSRRSDPCQGRCTSILGWSSSSLGGPDTECLQPRKSQSRRSCDQSSRKRAQTEEGIPSITEKSFKWRVAGCW